MPPFLRDAERVDAGADEDEEDGALPPRAFAQRARAAAASFARVAADIGRRRRSPPPLVLLLLLLLLTLRLVDDEDSEPPPNNARMRSCNASICSRRETASLSLSRDRSMNRSNLLPRQRN